jgi:hypothetical protein
MGMQVKGSIVVNLVKMIKKDKSGVYNNYLTEKDKAIISQKILPSSWYPFDMYKRCLNAIFEVIAKKDLKIAKEWGRIECQTAMSNIYARVIEGCDPLSFIKRYEVTHQNFYDFGKTEIIVEGKNRVVYKLSEFDAQFYIIYYLIQGWIEHGLELCGAKNIKSEFLTKSWEGHSSTSMRFTWN